MMADATVKYLCNTHGSVIEFDAVPSSPPITCPHRGCGQLLKRADHVVVPTPDVATFTPPESNVVQFPPRDTLPPPQLDEAARRERATERATSIEARFVAYHAEHPDVYVKLRELGRDLIERGYKRLGIGMLWETLRYFTMLGADVPDEDRFRLNDHYRSRYARLLMEQEPEFVGVFELRELRSP